MQVQVRTRQTSKQVVIARAPGRFGLASLMLLALWGCGGAAPPPPIDTGSTSEDIRRLIERARDSVFPALVHIEVVMVHHHGGRARKHRAVGSGVIVSRDGHVITNQHVVHRGERFRCTLADQRSVPARLVGEDPLTDLAVLALDLDALGVERDLAVARMGDSERLAVGEMVMAMGSPLSLARSVSLGIVSNPARVFTRPGDDDVGLELDEGQRTGLFTRWIQHDALIQPGNSGGPLVNLSGEVVGFNELGGMGMGFAVPSNLAWSVYERLVAHGAVDRSWIGLELRTLRGTGLSAGAVVDSVIADSPAARLGLNAGDVLLAVDGEPVAAAFPEELPPILARIAERPIGSRVALSWRRDADGKSMRGEASTLRFEPDAGENESLRAWGLSVKAVTQRVARELSLSDTRGVLVTSVMPGGPSATALPALGNGDVLIAVDDQPITDLAAFRAAIASTTADAAPARLVAFDRQGVRLLTLVTPATDRERPNPRELPKAWLGIATQPLAGPLAERVAPKDVTGFRVTRVYPGTRAADSGLLVGDVIVALDGEPLRARGRSDHDGLDRVIRAREVGATVRVGALREGKTVEVTATLEETRTTPDQAAIAESGALDLVVRELTFFDRDQSRWAPEVSGLVVMRVDGGGWLGDAGLRHGDLVEAIDGAPIGDVAAFRAAVERLETRRPARFTVQIRRGPRTRVLFVEPEWS